jgi:hypothetical protein
MRTVKFDDAEMQRMAREEGLETIRPELGTRRRAYYRNMWHFAKCFIGRTVSRGRAKNSLEAVLGIQHRVRRF